MPLRSSVRGSIVPGRGGLPHTCLALFFPLFPSSCPFLGGTPGDGSHASDSLAPGELWVLQSLPLSSFKSKKLRKEADEPCSESWRGPPCFCLQPGTCGKNGDVKAWKQQESESEGRRVVSGTPSFSAPVVQELPQQRALGSRRHGNCPRGMEEGSRQRGFPGTWV